MESSESTTSEGTQPGTSSEYVDLHEASDADLAAFLDNAGKDEAVEAPAPVAQQASPETKQETKAEQQAEPPKPEQSKADYEELAKKYEKVQRQLDGLELYSKRRASDIAEVKKQLREYIDTTAATLDDKFLESPTQALVEARKLEAAQEQLRAAEAEEQSLQNAQQAQVLLAHHVGADGLDPEAIGQALASDGMPPEFIQQFLSNPYQAALPETLIQLAKRAQAEKKARQIEAALEQIVPFTQKLLEERKALPNNVLKNVQSALRQSPQVTGSAGGTGQVGGNRAVEFSQMSDAELAEFLKG